MRAGEGATEQEDGFASIGLCNSIGAPREDPRRSPPLGITFACLLSGRKSSWSSSPLAELLRPRVCMCCSIYTLFPRKTIGKERGRGRGEVGTRLRSVVERDEGVKSVEIRGVVLFSRPEMLTFPPF